MGRKKANDVLAILQRSLLKRDERVLNIILILKQ